MATAGVLAYRGYDIHDLAEHATFEEVCYLLWHGRLPSRAELGELQSQLAASRRAARRRAAPDAVAAAVECDGHAAHARRRRSSHYDPGANDMSPAGRYRTSVTLTAQVGDRRGDAGRMASGGGIIEPDPGAEPRGELPVHAHREAAERARRRRRSTSRSCCTPTTSSTRPRSRRASRLRR